MKKPLKAFQATHTGIYIKNDITGETIEIDELTLLNIEIAINDLLERDYDIEIKSKEYYQWMESIINLYTIDKLDFKNYPTGYEE